MSPFHPVRQRFDRVIEPLLNPIRRVIPTVGMIDFSPLILILLVQVVSLIIKNVLISLL
jgi:YggT family protein